MDSHKVNPIDFENAKGNFGLAASLGEFFARKGVEKINTNERRMREDL